MNTILSSQSSFSRRVSNGSGESLEKWLAPASVELRIGGRMDIDFGEDEVVGGEIIDLVPGVALEYHWRFTGKARVNNPIRARID